MNQTTGTRYSAKDFIDALKTKKLGASAPTLSGFVKLDETNSHLLFAPRGCDRWVQVPFDAIEEIEYLGTRRCRDHTHPWARLRLRTSESVESSLLGVLLEQDGSPVEADGARTAPDAFYAAPPLPPKCRQACYDCEFRHDPQACDTCVQCQAAAGMSYAGMSYGARRARPRPQADHDFDCETACRICQRYPWKEGPCWVCDYCTVNGG